MTVITCYHLQLFFAVRSHIWKIFDVFVHLWNFPARTVVALAFERIDFELPLCWAQSLQRKNSFSDRCRFRGLLLQELARWCFEYAIWDPRSHIVSNAIINPFSLSGDQPYYLRRNVSSISSRRIRAGLIVWRSFSTTIWLSTLFDAKSRARQQIGHSLTVDQ